MTYGTLSEEDRREERRRLREEAREARANGDGGDPDRDPAPEPEPEPIPTPEPVQAPEPDRVEPQPDPPSPEPEPEPAPAAFEPVADLPKLRRGRGWKIPAVRAQMIAYLREHPGQWVKYQPGDADPAKPTSVASQLARECGGFEGGGFECTRREGVMYFRYRDLGVVS